MLNRLKTDLLEAPPEACLPRNLSDAWCEFLAASADIMLKEGDDDTGDGEAIVAVLVRILIAKSAGQTAPREIPFEDLFEFTKMYRIELALEEIHRKTEMTYNPATLETILTEREITTWAK